MEGKIVFGIAILLSIAFQASAELETEDEKVDKDIQDQKTKNFLAEFDAFLKSLTEEEFNQLFDLGKELFLQNAEEDANEEEQNVVQDASEQEIDQKDEEELEDIANGFRDKDAIAAQKSDKTETDVKKSSDETKESKTKKKDNKKNLLSDINDVDDFSDEDIAKLMKLFQKQ